MGFVLIFPEIQHDIWSIPFTFWHLVAFQCCILSQSDLLGLRGRRYSDGQDDC